MHRQYWEGHPSSCSSTTDIGGALTSSLYTPHPAPKAGFKQSADLLLLAY